MNTRDAIAQTIERMKSTTVKTCACRYSAMHLKDAVEIGIERLRELGWQDSETCADMFKPCSCEKLPRYPWAAKLDLDRAAAFAAAQDGVFNVERLKETLDP